MHPESPAGPAIPVRRRWPSAPVASRPRSWLPRPLAQGLAVALVLVRHVAGFGHPRRSSRVCLSLRKGDVQQALIVAGIDALLVDAPGQAQLEPERTLANLGEVVDDAGVRRQP